MSKFPKLAFIAAAVVMVASVSAQEVSTSPATKGAIPASRQPINSNWVNGNGEFVWMNGTGEHCLRSSDWSPATANKGCDGALVETPPAPPPAPAPTPVAPITSEKVTYRTEVNFDFDKVELKPEAKEKLDELATKVKGMDNVEVVVVSGYTDKMGPNAYNNKLSWRRAEVGKGELVDHGIDENHIYTEGKGKSNPIVTGCEEKLGKMSKRNRAALINCLAPNRRVEIEAVGTVNRSQSQPGTLAPSESAGSRPSVQPESNSAPEPLTSTPQY